MYCTNCGAHVPDCVSFCTNCGTKVTNTDTKTSENPYAAAQTAAVNNEAQGFNQPYSQNYAEPYSQPYTQNYNQPEAQPVSYQPQAQNYPESYSQNYTQPQAPQSHYPTYQTQQNFPNTPPQYMRPVQTPQGIQYVAVDPSSYIRPLPPEPKHNPFTFISAGIAGLMFLLCFFPWFTVDGSGFNLFRVFSDNIYLELFEMDAVAACSLFMIVAMGLLTPYIILVFLRKNRLPIGFAIAASAITIFTLFIFLVLVADSKGNVEATAVPVAMFVLSVLNIVFPAIARKA